MSERSTLCTFTGGTLHGTKQPRLMFGYTPVAMMEPVYEPASDKDLSLLYRNITHRQTYVRDPKQDRDGALAYRLDTIVASVQA